MILPISEPKEIVIHPAIPEKKIIISQVEVLKIVDDCTSAVIATIIVNGMETELALWEGDDYTAIGDWTQDQANARIIELL